MSIKVQYESKSGKQFVRTIKTNAKWVNTQCEAWLFINAIYNNMKFKVLEINM